MGDGTALRCLVLDDYQGVALSCADWSGLDGAVEVAVSREHLAGADAVVRALAGYQIVVAMRERTPLPAAVLERLPDLRLIVTTGMRNASIDVAAATRLGISVSGTASATTPTVELTWALILGLARHLVPENAAVRAGGWQHTVGLDLHGARLGLLGLGRIGGEVARVGVAFGMRVAAWSQNLTAERAAGAGARLAASKEELLAGSDIVSIHLVLGDRTRGLVGAAELARMRPTALLVNTSRAAIVDQSALVDALRRGVIAGAAVDVFEQEPPPADHPLRTLPNLLATPHLGYVTRANYARMYADAVEDIRAYLAGQLLRPLS